MGLVGLTSSRDQFEDGSRIKTELLVKMIPIDVWRARIGLFNNFRSRRSIDERVEALIELRARLSRRAKGKRVCGEEVATGQQEKQCKEEEKAGETEQGGGEGSGEGGAGVERSSFDRVRMLLKMLVVLLFLLLIVSGSVELNPGPGLSEYECIVS